MLPRARRRQMHELGVRHRSANASLEPLFHQPFAAGTIRVLFICGLERVVSPEEALAGSARQTRLVIQPGSSGSGPGTRDKSAIVCSELIGPGNQAIHLEVRSTTDVQPHTGQQSEKDIQEIAGPHESFRRREKLAPQCDSWP